MPDNNSFRAAANFFKLGLLSFALLASLSATAKSQSTGLTLTVKVTDPAGKTVSGVPVEIKKDGSTQPLTATTSPDGIATFTNLEPGVYQLSVAATGFSRFNKSIDLKTDLTQDVTLEPSRRLQVQAEAVTRDTKAAIPLVKTTTESDRESISSLPNQNNDLILAQIVPGALPLGASALGQIVVDGKGVDQTTARLDGVDYTLLIGLPTADGAIDPTSSYKAPSVAGNQGDSQLRTGAFEARFGPGTGGVLDNVTYTAYSRGNKAWTAEFYGENQNDFFNARNFFDGEDKNGLRRTRFGGKAGRAFDPNGRSLMFVAYDGIRGRVERQVFEAVPIDSVCCPAQPFTQLFRSYVPVGTEIMTGASQNPDFLIARRRARTTVNSNAFDLRYEYRPFVDAKVVDDDGAVSPAPRATDVLTLRYTRQGTENLVPDGVTGRQQRQNILFNNLLAGLTFMTSENTTHWIRFGLNAVRARLATELPPGVDPSLSASFLTVSGTVSATGLPVNSVSIASLGTVMKGIGRGFRLAPVSYNLNYEVERKFDKHTLNAGGEGRLIRTGFDRLGGLTYAFPNIAALRAGTPTSVNFQSDLSAASPFTPGTGPRQARQEYAMGYIQILWKIGKASEDPTFKNEKIERLRITTGLRYDYFSPVRERDGRVVVVDPVSGQILPPGTSFYSTRKFNFQPRASLIYRFADTGTFSNTVFSVGAGSYSGTARIADYLLPIDSDRFSTGMSALLFPVSSSVLQNNFLTNPSTRQFQPLTFSRDFVGVERAYKWDASLSQTYKGYDFGLLYSGNVGRDLPIANIANKITHVFTNPDPTQLAIVQREFDIVNNGQIFKPFGEFFFRTSDGRSRYDGVTLQLKRNRNARPIPTNKWFVTALPSFTAQYTWSRSVGNTNGTIRSNPFDLNADFGDNVGVPRHFFKLSGVYELWMVKKSALNSWLDWKIMPVLKLSSGLPLIVQLTRPDVVYVDANGRFFSSPAVGRTAVINTPGGGETGAARIPNLVPGVNPYLRNDREYLNPAAFSIPAPGQFGNIRRGSLHGPSVAQFDLGLRKNLFQTEKLFSGQFQIDIFNVFNHTNFFNPTVALPGRLGTDTLAGEIQPGVPLSRAAAGSFGMLSAADSGRTIQFSFTLRLNNGFTSYRAPIQ